MYVEGFSLGMAAGEITAESTVHTGVNILINQQGKPSAKEMKKVMAKKMFSSEM